MTHKIILDTDPGIDDAAAITIAMNHPEIDLKLLTTVVGNVDVDKTTLNALKLATYYDNDTPIAKGARKPLIREHEDASYVHGVSGMDGFDFPEPNRTVVKGHAVEVIRETLLASDEPITLVPVGALTNIALLLNQYPEVKDKIERIVLMGGGIFAGNTTSHAEFNIYTDPHAAQMVFQSGVPIVMVGLDVTHKALLTQDSLDKLADLGPAGEMLHALFVRYGDTTPNKGTAMHDVCTMFYLLHPDKVKTEDYHIEVALDGPAMGATIADIRHAYYDNTNATVCVDIDAEFFNKWFLETIGSFAK